MARTAGSDGSRTVLAIRQAAVDLIAAHGFEAVTLRAIARHVGVQAGTIYRYYPSKSSLLMDLISTHMEQLFAHWAEVDPGAADPTTRLNAFVAFHVHFHAEKPKEVLIANMEMRSLESGDRQRVVEMRLRYEAILLDILRAGIAQKRFAVPDVRVATYAILAMLTGLTAWYQEGGRMTKDELAACYSRLVLTGVSAT